MKNIRVSKMLVLFILITLVGCNSNTVSENKKGDNQIENKIQDETNKPVETAQNSIARATPQKTGSIINNSTLSNKIDIIKARDFFNKYTPKYNEAIGTNDFSKVEEFYLKDSEAYISHVNFVKLINKDNEKFKVLNIDIKEFVKDSGTPNQYFVYLVERTSYKAPNKPEKISEDRFKFVLVSVDDILKISQTKDWNKQGGNMLKENTNQQSQNNIIDKDFVKVGDIISGLTIKSINIKDESLSDVTFSGEIEIEGEYEWISESGDGGKLVFTVNTADSSKIPVLKGLSDLRNISIKNTSYAKKLLLNKSGKCKVRLGNYSVGERQIPISAELIKVIK